jgi:hypothetical protein
MDDSRVPVSNSEYVDMMERINKALGISVLKTEIPESPPEINEK